MAEGGSDGLDRRAFIKRMAVGAFAIPVIASFQLDSLARAGAPKGGGHTWPNQSHGNQTLPGIPPVVCYPNQTQADGLAGTQSYYPNQTYPNQTYPNQPFPTGTPPQLEHLLQQLRKVCKPRRKKRRLQ